jgi:hypothetical protein
MLRERLVEAIWNLHYPQPEWPTYTEIAHWRVMPNMPWVPYGIDPERLQYELEKCYATADAMIGVLAQYDA